MSEHQVFLVWDSVSQKWYPVCRGCGWVGALLSRDAVEKRAEAHEGKK